MKVALVVQQLGVLLTAEGKVEVIEPKEDEGKDKRRGRAQRRCETSRPGHVAGVRPPPWDERAVGDHVAIRAGLRKAGVQLVSVTETIEETASGKLVEGIHALMAEFFSANLATEVRKGMTQKAKQGLWPAKAPIGYLNLREPGSGKRGTARSFSIPSAPFWCARRFACTRPATTASPSSKVLLRPTD